MMDDDNSFSGSDKRNKNTDNHSLSPEQNQRILDAIYNKAQLTSLKNTDRTYLVFGPGEGKEEEYMRRKKVRDKLDKRPNAEAYFLEDFDLTEDDMDVWCHGFNQLAGLSSDAVGVFEEYNGGYVWEMGLLFSRDYNDEDIDRWFLKREYEDEEKSREKYDNSMAYSDLKSMEKTVADQLLKWKTEEELMEKVDEIN